MSDLKEIWNESLERFTERGVQKISETSMPQFIQEGVKLYFDPKFGKEILRLGIELLHEQIADVENLR